MSENCTAKCTPRLQRTCNLRVRALSTPARPETRTPLPLGFYMHLCKKKKTAFARTWAMTPRTESDQTASTQQARNQPAASTQQAREDNPKRCTETCKTSQGCAGRSPGAPISRRLPQPPRAQQARGKHAASTQPGSNKQTTNTQKHDPIGAPRYAKPPQDAQEETQERSSHVGYLPLPPSTANTQQARSKHAACTQQARRKHVASTQQARSKQATNQLHPWKRKGLLLGAVAVAAAAGVVVGCVCCCSP